MQKISGTWRTILSTSTRTSFSTGLREVAFHSTRLTSSWQGASKKELDRLSESVGLIHGHGAPSSQVVPIIWTRWIEVKSFRMEIDLSLTIPLDAGGRQSLWSIRGFPGTLAGCPCQLVSHFDAGDGGWHHIKADRRCGLGICLSFSASRSNRECATALQPSLNSPRHSKTSEFWL